jgi:hypothetical protein
MRSDRPILSNYASNPPVVLGSFGEPPIVRGMIKPRLTWPQYLVVKALLEAGEIGLTKYQLDAKTDRTDARKVLKRLHDSDADWAAVIHMPGIPGRHYRIA